MTSLHWLNEARLKPQSPAPLRFFWQMEPDGRCSIDSTEFLAIMGPLTAALLRQPFSFVASAMRDVSDEKVARAIEARNTFSGLLVQWPVDGSDRRLPVEMSALPVFDREHTFSGYCGFGVCRDIAGIDAIVAARRSPAAVPSTTITPTATLPPEVDAPQLTPAERDAFYELGRELTKRINEFSRARP
jgi:hypothetical protein